MIDRNIRLTKQGIRLQDRVLPFLSGSCHYWRLERSKWPLILDRFADLGFPLLQTYVPWSVHETGPGQFDFGQFTPNKDLPGFLKLCAERDLYVLLRPGPHINAEITYFGYPKRIFDNPDNLAVSATGGSVLLPVPPRTFPTISYASDHFYKELAIYYDAFAEIALPFCYPDGPVIGIQADNEMSYFFRTATYDQDYSHWAKEMYLAWIKEKYGDLENVRRVYDRQIASFSDLTPPVQFNARRPEDLPYYLDWCQFKEEMLHLPLERMLEMLRDRGLDGLVSYHNYPVNLLHTPFNISRGEQAFDFVGVDYYNQKTDYLLSRKRFLALSGTSRFPTSPEFSSGCYQAWAPIELEDQEFNTYLALACGIRGFNFYMTVERERWYGSPITRHGDYRPAYAEFYKRLNRFLKTSRITTMDRVADVILLRSRDYDRLEKAADLLSPLPPLVFEGKLGAAERCHEGKLGFERCIQIDHDRMFDAWYDGLTRAKIPFALSDTDIDPQLLSKYKVIILPTFDFLDRVTQNYLHDFVEKGGTLIIGPDVPSLDSQMIVYSTLDQYVGRPVHKLECEPDTFVCNAGAGRILLVNGQIENDPKSADRLVEQIAKFIRLSPVYPASGPCETTAFTDDRGRWIVFIINPTDQMRRPRIYTGGKVMFRDLLTSDEFFGGDHIEVHMNPYSVRPVEVLSC